MFETIKSFFAKSAPVGAPDSDNADRPFYPATSSEYSVTELNRTDYIRLYKSWVYLCVSTIADSVANLSYTLERNGKSVDHKHLGLITPDLLRYVATQMLLTGTSYLWKMRVGAYVDELYRLRSDTMTIDEKSDGSINCFRYNGGRSQITLQPEDVADFSLSNPFETYPYTVKGMSPVAAIAMQAEMDNAANKWNWNFFRNGATVGGTLETDAMMDSANKELLARKWKAQFQGVNNAHSVAVLDQGLQYKPMQTSKKEMDFVDGRRFTRDEILAIFKVPPAVVGLTDNANRASATVALETYFRICISPLAAQIAEVLTKELFDGVGKFYFTNVIPADAEQLKNDLALGAISVNEYRQARGYDRVDGYDDIEPPAEPVPPAEVPKSALFLDVRARLAKRIPGTPEHKAAREEYGKKKWEAKIARTSKQEKEFTKKVKAIFAKQEQDVLAALGNTKKIDWSKPSEITWRAMWASLATVYRDIFLVEGSAALAEVGVSGIFQVGNPRINGYIKDMVGRVAKQANDTTVAEIEAIVKQGNEEGVGAAEMALRIKRKFAEFSRTRAEMIARTETTTASTYAEIDAWKSSGVVSGKEWYTAPDERVCKQCNAMHGKVLEDVSANFFDKGATFQGVKLDYMDVKGPSLHPSCRCTLLPVVK